MSSEQPAAGTAPPSPNRAEEGPAPGPDALRRQVYPDIGVEIDAVVPDVPAEPRAVLEAVAGRRREMEEFLADLVRVETPSLEPETMAPAFELLRGRLEESGYRCRRRSGRETGGSLLATRRQRRRGEPSQLLLGHVDTVWPVGTLEGMPLQRDRARMRGPGVYDMKGGLTQTLFALQALRDLELDPEVEPVVFVNSDEEIGSGESDDIIRRLARIVDRTLVMEPSLGPSGKLKTARKGVHQYEVIVRGRAAHAGLNPEEGISAILELSYLIQRLFALNDTERGVSVNVGQIDGGMRPNVVAPQSRAWVDVRVPTRQDAERIDAAIHDLEPSRDDVTVEVRCPEDSRAPMVPCPASRLLWYSALRWSGDLGIELEEGTAGGASDGNITSQYTATLDGLGAVGGGAHAEHEFVDLDRMVERTALLALLLLHPPVARYRRMAESD